MKKYRIPRKIKKRFKSGVINSIACGKYVRVITVVYFRSFYFQTQIIKFKKKFLQKSKIKQ